MEAECSPETAVTVYYIRTVSCSPTGLFEPHIIPFVCSNLASGRDGLVMTSVSYAVSALPGVFPPTIDVTQTDRQQITMPDVIRIVRTVVSYVECVCGELNWYAYLFVAYKCCMFVRPHPTRCTVPCLLWWSQNVNQTVGLLHVNMYDGERRELLRWLYTQFICEAHIIIVPHCT